MTDRTVAALCIACIIAAVVWAEWSSGSHTADLAEIEASMERQAARVERLETELADMTRERDLALNIAARAILYAERVYEETQGKD